MSVYTSGGAGSEVAARRPFGPEERSQMAHPFSPRAQGLYDPRFEHDACGVGFVVDVARAPVARHRRPGAAGAAQPRAPRRLRLREEHRRRRRHPRADAPRLPRRRVRRGGHHAARAGELRRRHGLPADATPASRRRCEEIVERTAAEEGLRLPRLARRPDRQRPARRHRARRRSRSSARCSSPAPTPIEDDLAFERKLYVAAPPGRERGARLRRPAARALFYVPSLSHRTIVYKGMLDRPPAADLLPGPRRPARRVAPWPWSTRASRTNTFPNWARAHPYRYICHNGEINTLRGNVNWMHARESLFESTLFGDDLRKILPGHRHRRQRLGDVRQRPRAARPRRPVAAARDDDDDPGAVEPGTSR